MDRVVIITGAGQGIGRATACYLAEQGASVVVNDLDTISLENVVSEIKSAGGNAVAIAGSVADWDFSKQLIATALNNYGRLDALINNAGLHYVSKPNDESPEKLKQLIDVNVIGSMYCGLQALNVFTKQRHGSLINLSSAAHLGVESQAIYSASKGAIASLTYSWAIDAMPFGVRVNAVAPLANTGMIDALPQFQNKDASGYPLIQEASAIAPLFGFLVSDDSAEISGQIVRFNGRELSLIDHPAVRVQSNASDDWDISLVNQTFERLLVQHLSPLGFAASTYAWSPEPQ